ncbi:MAG: biotin/lipoyl-binding protein [Deltaproteobacteria bacterium]|nr:biotin/lipoyl-binding protein [Deltaproteobacteria bacterium]
MGTYSFVIDENSYDVEVGDWEGNRVRVTVNGTTHLVELQQGGLSQPAGASSSMIPSPLPSVSPPTSTPAVSNSVVSNGSLVEIRAPMVGQVLSILVTKGKHVKAGDKILALEAMKMENIIYAPADGTVEKIAVQIQQTVNRGDLLIAIRPS